MIKFNGMNLVYCPFHGCSNKHYFFSPWLLLVNFWLLPWMSFLFLATDTSMKDKRNQTQKLYIELVPRGMVLHVWKDKEMTPPSTSTRPVVLQNHGHIVLTEKTCLWKNLFYGIWRANLYSFKKMVIGLGYLLFIGHLASKWSFTRMERGSMFAGSINPMWFRSAHERSDYWM